MFNLRHSTKPIISRLVVKKLKNQPKTVLAEVSGSKSEV